MVDFNLDSLIEGEEREREEKKEGQVVVNRKTILIAFKLI